MTPTLRVLELTLLMSLPWSVFLLCLGWRLDSAMSQTELSLALAWGLKVTGIVLLPLELIRHVCRGHGLGQDHFGWPEAGLKAIRRRLRWFMLIGLPLTLAAAATHTLDNERWKDSLGRMLFIGAMLLLAVFIQRILRSLRRHPASVSGQPRSLTPPHALPFTAAVDRLALVAGRAGDDRLLLHRGTTGRARCRSQPGCWWRC